MPARDSDLLFGLVALERGLVKRAQLLKVLDRWAKAPRVRLARLLGDAGLLSPSQRREVAREAAARGRRAGAAAAAATSLRLPAPLRRTLLAPAPRTSTRKRTAAPAAAPSVVAGEPVADPPAVASQDRKYLLGDELGRGGLGRVVEATDTLLGRQVALKLMLAEAPGEAVERFRWEARITGRLEHPNIVPVHEMGQLGGGGATFFSMKKILGRDLGRVIAEGERPLRRLVEAFRDACRAVAYAHSRGIIHRDLKPSNVMLGEYGETLVVDWGLARVLGEDVPEPGRPPRPPGAERAASSAESTRLTMEGDVLGTPAYMPPEQAMGRLAELDERSDVYSLGAILYEILAKRPPFAGNGPWEVIENVIREEVTPPSAHAAVPPELEAVCLKALAKKKPDRHASAADLATDVDRWLEGTLERERRARMAAEATTRARSHLDRWRACVAESRDLRARAEAAQAALPAGAPLERQRAVWAEQDRSLQRERESAEALSEAEAALAAALSAVPDHAEARALSAELHWDRFRAAEAARDRTGMVLFRRLVEAHDDGTWAPRLRGDGTVAVRARAWACPCLERGRDVAPDELWIAGNHAWSGRRRDNASVEHDPALETRAAVRLRVHGHACRREPLAGARVWAFRYEDVDRVQIPVTPGPSESPIPDPLLDRLFGDSPFRPRGGGLFLGSTPLAARPWPMGSWLLIVAADGRLPARVPFVVKREQAVDLELTLYAPGEIPRGFVPVPGGRFTYQADSGPDGTAPYAQDLEDYLIARDPVTCLEYLEFLNGLRRADPGEAARRVPRAAEAGDPFWPETAAGYAIPTAEWIGQAGDAARRRRFRPLNAAADWREDWPVLAVSWLDALAFARWSALKAGALLTLPLETQWEFAARGWDERLHPWGSGWCDLLCNFRDSRPNAMHPVAVSGFPFDESPFGVRGMGGNAGGWCLSWPGEKYAGLRSVRGGSWVHVASFCRATRRAAQHYRTPAPGAGIRLAAATVLRG